MWVSTPHHVEPAEEPARVPPSCPVDPGRSAPSDRTLPMASGRPRRGRGRGVSSLLVEVEDPLPAARTGRPVRPVLGSGPVAAATAGRRGGPDRTAAPGPQMAVKIAAQLSVEGHL